jgi:hypothetical protein
MGLKSFPSIECDGGDADAGLGMQLGWLMTYRKFNSKRVYFLLKSPPYTRINFAGLIYLTKA